MNPFLLGGLFLALVPILIHLFNRQRHRPMPWAAMRFVLAAYKQTRRRVRFEDWLLLFLRVLAVLALVLCVARPYTGQDGPLASLTESRRDLAIVIDGSASTGYRNELDTVFERSVDRARALVDELDGQRGDRCHLILAGAWPRLLAWGDPSNARQALEVLSEPTDEDMNLAGALGEVLEFALEEAANTEQSHVEVRLLTDLQRGNFTRDLLESDGEDALQQGDTGLLAALDQLAALGLSVQVEDLAGGERLPPNLSVQSITVEGPWLGAGVPLDVRVQVVNHGSAPKMGVRVALEIDAVRRPSQVLDIDGLAQAEASFPTLFETSGDHALCVQLEGDALPIDDTRCEVLYVPPPVEVLLVNGAPDADFRKDSAARLEVVLQPSLDEDSLQASQIPFQPTVVEVRDLENGDVKLEDFDLIWLVNVASLSPSVLERLEAHVGAGASLVISLGDRVQRETFNKQFWRADASGLSPAELGEVLRVASRRNASYRIATFDSEHPALTLFAEERWKSLLTEAPFYAFFSTRPLPTARIMARLDDPKSSALFLERKYDRGRVLLWSSSMDESWTAFPTWGPALVPFVYDLVRDAGRRERKPHTLHPGGSFVAEVTSFPRQMELITPSDAHRTLDRDALELSEGRWQLPAIEGNATARSGLYRVETEGAGSLLFAVQLQPSESVLERLGGAELESIHGALRLRSSTRAGQDTGGAAGRGELWRALAIAALLALCAESLWSAWIGRRRRIA